VSEVIPKVDTTFRYQGLSDASITMEALFDTDLFPVMDGAEDVIALGMHGPFEASLRTDEFGELVANRHEGAEFNLALVDLDGLRSAIAGLACVIRSESYIQGRLDQLADLFGSNDVRAVKAKDLGKVYDDACLRYDSDDIITEGGKANYLSVAKQLRGVLDLVPVNDQDGLFVIELASKAADTEDSK
jgi:hypothetical protein